MSKYVKEVTDSSFEQDVLMAKGPVLVDFWADWCSPCKQLSPIVDDIAETFAGELTVCKLNADENPETAAAWRVRGLPTMIVFANGEEKERLNGLMSKSRIAGAIEKQLES